MNIKNKTISGLKWSITEKAASQFIHFILGIILARLLSPEEYGIVGMVTVFIMVSQTFIDSGLSHALIREKHCSDIDYNTIFFTNIALGIIAFALLFLSSELISNFYSEPRLNMVVKIMSINLIISSFGLVEAAKLIKEVDFKRQTKVTLVSDSAAGVIGITLAATGYGYWSLVIKTICGNIFRVMLLNYTSKWKPKLQYSIDSFRRLFSFGIKVLGAALVKSAYNNLYKLVVGKVYSATDLGFLNRAEQFNTLISHNLQLTMHRVSFPVMSTLNDDEERLKSVFRKFRKISFYTACTAMLFMLVNSREIILILLGEKWAPAIPYLKILCLSGMMFPLYSLGADLINVKGRSDIFLKIELLSKMAYVPLIILLAHISMTYLLWGIVAMSIMSSLLYSSSTAKLIKYTYRQQIIDILPTVLHTLILAGLGFWVGTIGIENIVFVFALKSSTLLFALVLGGEVLNLYEYHELKKVFKLQILGYIDIWRKVVNKG